MASIGQVPVLTRVGRCITQLDLGFILLRAALMLPILTAARFMDPAEFGEYSQMFHQLLIVSTVILFGVHDRVTVEGAVNVSAEAVLLAVRLVVLLPIVVVYDNGWLALATLLFLHFTRSGPMVLLAAMRAVRAPGLYLAVCAGAVASSGCLALAYALGWTTLAATTIATAAMIPAWVVALAGARSAGEQVSLDLRQAFTGWDYFLNFLLTSLYTQGVLFITSFVTTSTEYATVSRVMYLVQAGILVQSVAYRIVLSGLVDGSFSLRSVLLVNSALGLAWLAVMAVGGGWVEALLFGRSVLSGPAYVLVGILVVLQSFNLALAPYLLARGAVRRTLIVPAVTLGVALVFGAAWNYVNSPYTIYAMIGAITAAGLVTRIVITRRLEPVHA